MVRVSLAIALLTGGGAGTWPVANAQAPVGGNPRVRQVLIQHTATSTENAQLVFLDKAIYPSAICNDGSAAAYVYRHGSGAAASRWIINLQEGGKCYDQETCSGRAARSPELVSSDPYRQDPTKALGVLGGIQDPDPSVNPDFYDATQVEMLYCSSDDWSGAKTVATAFDPNDDATWSFLGHAIVAAVIDDLERSRGLNDAKEILFSGQSAGGIGAFVNVNDVARLVPAQARFLATADAGFIATVDNFDPQGAPPDYTDNSVPNEMAQRILGITLWNGSGESICAGLADSLRDKVSCYYAARLLRPGGPIRLPMFVSQAQKDTAQLSFDGLPRNATTDLPPSEAGYVAYFASRMRAQLAAVSDQVSIFSPDAFLHMETNDPSLLSKPYSYQGRTITLQQAIGAWYRDPDKVQRYILN